jgi:hypothetical protein
MTENRLEARIFGMFCLEPSTLLSVPKNSAFERSVFLNFIFQLTVATVSYLIILIQFTEPGSSRRFLYKGTAGERNFNEDEVKNM